MAAISAPNSSAKPMFRPSSPLSFHSIQLVGMIGELSVKNTTTAMPNREATDMTTDRTVSQRQRGRHFVSSRYPKTIDGGAKAKLSNHTGTSSQTTKTA